MCMFLFFFFNDTATTEIYTYLHTLSLHDALPIFLDVDAKLLVVRLHERGTIGKRCRELDLVRLLEALVHVEVVLRIRRVLLEGVELDALVLHTHRSEEHTSEIQSLMRITYAVVCLKKKKPQQLLTQDQSREAQYTSKHILH